MSAIGNDRAVAFVGPKHAGKSRVGAAFAALVGRTFIDLDDLIRDRTGRTPSSLYEESPERFRQAEAEAAAALEAEPSSLVVAAGGGLIDNPMALARLKAIAILVYLQTDADTAWRRILRTAETRGGLPVFLQGDDPETIHRRLFERRAAAYELAADLRLDARSASPEDLAAAAAAALWPDRFSVSKTLPGTFT